MTVDPLLPVSVSIAASANPVCAGTAVTFTATPANGGTTPAYQWMVNGIAAGTDNPVYAYTPANGDLVTCQLTSALTCTTGNPALSLPVTMAVNAGTPVSVSISASVNPVCEGIPVTFTATPVNGGSAPVFEWKVNGAGAGTNNPLFTYVPLNGDTVNCLLTSNLTCPGANPVYGNQVTMVVNAIPVVTLTSCNDPVTITTAKPFKLKGGVPNGGVYSGPGINPATGIFDPLAAGPGIKTITYTYTTAGLCQAGATLDITVLNEVPFTCGQNVTDVRDNKTYPTVQLGSQCWFAANLDYGTTIPGNLSQRDNCTPEKYCYSDGTGNCLTLGALYQWDELMQYDTIRSAQGFCPPGWHIPAESEWLQLFNLYGGNAYAGDSLKQGGPSAFNALLAGVRFNNQSWSFLNFTGFIWSSDEHGPGKSWAHGFNINNHGISFYPSNRSNGFSVRCLKD
jgi:uncharacterized protein (TIGR02145 family)